MKKTLLFLLTTGIVSCTENRTRAYHVCNCEQSMQVADFIKNSISDANNKSDEEMEDVIIQLERTAVKIYCPMKNISADIDQGHILRLKSTTDSCMRIFEY